MTTGDLLTPDRPWVLGIETVRRTREQIRGQRFRSGPPARQRQYGSIEWQAGQTLGIFYATLAVTSGFTRVLVDPFGADAQHRPKHGGTGQLGDTYPALLCGRRDLERPADWYPNDTTLHGGAGAGRATGTRGEHERAAWAIAVRAACEFAGIAWSPGLLRELAAGRGPALPPAVGVDSGADWTAIVACHGGRVFNAATVGRATHPAHLAGADAQVDLYYVDRFVATLAGILTTHRPHAVQACQSYLAEVGGEQQPADAQGGK